MDLPAQCPAAYYPAQSAHPRSDSGTSAPDEPSPADLADARRYLAECGITSPVQLSRPLSERFGREVWVKYESFLEVGSFKLRGAMWAVHQAKARGAATVVTASTGNHGQGVALAGQRLGIPVTVFMPDDVDAVKQRRMREFGADVRAGGKRLADAETAALDAARLGAVFIEDGENPDLMAGAASIGLELAEQVPHADIVIAPVGGGNLSAALCLALACTRASTRIVGAQSRAAPGVALSWLAGRLVQAECNTLAGGLATERPGRLALSVLLRHLAGIAVIDEDDLWNAVRLAYENLSHNLELAAVAPLAALERFPDEMPGSTVVVVASGSCIDAAQLGHILTGGTRTEWLTRTRIEDMTHEGQAAT